MRRLAGILLWIVGTCWVSALSQDSAADWQAAAGGKKSFDVASVKLDPGPFRPPNFPLDPGEAYRPVGGRFSADFALFTYITFAYKLGVSEDQRRAMMANVPAWVEKDRYAIEARADGTPTKDQMRLMMQALLAERFKLAAHIETRVFPAFAVELIKPGKTGPKLVPHSEGVPCDQTPATNGPMTRDGDVFPPVCDVVELTMKDRNVKGGSRNIPIETLAQVLPGMGRLGRAAVNRTGLTGRFDFSVEFVPEPNGPAEPAREPAPEVQGPSFIDAVREQLGLKLEPIKAELPLLVIDHVERPTAN